MITVFNTLTFTLHNKAVTNHDIKKFLSLSRIAIDMKE